MSIRRLTIALALCAVPCVVVGAEAAKTPMGERIGPIQFKDLRYLPRSLDDLGEAKAYVLVFINNSCPLVQRYMPRLKELHEKYGKEKVVVVGVNVGAGDTIMDMASHALRHGVLFPVVKDMDGSVAAALGVERTPEAVVLDGDRRLVYRGRIDSQYRLGGATPKAGRNDLEEAIREVIAGQPVSVAETPVDGCKITATAMSAPAEGITYAEHIAPLFKANCQSCHRPNTAAPFALTTYEEVSAYGDTIAEAVEDQRMPPWYAHHEFGPFVDGGALSKKDRDTVVQWVRAGMPEGDPSKAPPPLEPPTSKWRIGEPDLVIEMSQTHDIQADGYVPYQYVILPFVFFKETYLEAIEILPDNPSVVHHCNMAYGAMGAKVGPQSFITGYVPGGSPMTLGNGVAYKLPAGSVLGLQIHYTTTGKPERSKISVGLRFPREPVRKTLHHVIMDAHGFKIEPHHPAYPISDTKLLPKDVTLLGLFCHMHLRGKDMTFTAKKPDGTSEVLLEIPNYNFEWQLGYKYPEGQGKKLPGGTKLECLAHYDNSPFNPYNPDPNRYVPYGQQTYDEMLNGFVFFTIDEENLNLKINPRTGTAEESPKVAKGK